MSRAQGMFVGRAGQLAVMAEFLLRGYNVAVPEVDLGDDVFVVRDRDGALDRVQVKTATAKPVRDGFKALFRVGRTQLSVPRLPELQYVLAVRSPERWTEFLVISRARLATLHETEGVGKAIGTADIMFDFRFVSGAVTCDGKDLHEVRNDWSRWPVIT